MKTLIIFFMALVFGTAQAQPLPHQARVEMILENVELGSTCPEFVKGSSVIVDYDYNFETSVGWAHLKQLDNAQLNEPLWPIGVESMFGFMSNMSPTPVSLTKGDTTLYRVIFNLQKNGDAKALIMLGEEGDCLMSTNTVRVE